MSRVALRYLSKVSTNSFRTTSHTVKHFGKRSFSIETQIPSSVTDVPKSEKKTEEWTWGWSPPLNSKLVTDSGTGSTGIGSRDYKMPIVLRVPFTVEELCEAMEALGGLEVTNLEIDQRLDSVDFMVFCTGRSPAHLRWLLLLYFPFFSFFVFIT